MIKEQLNLKMKKIETGERFLHNVIGKKQIFPFTQCYREETKLHKHNKIIQTQKTYKKLGEIPN